MPAMKFQHLKSSSRIDLRELTIFGASYRTHSLEHWNDAKENALSDISLYNALMKLPSLKYLDIAQHLHKVEKNNLFLFDSSVLICNFSSLDFAVC